MEMAQYTQIIKNDPNWLPGKEAITNELKKRCGMSPHFIEIQEIKKKNTALYGIFICKDGSKCIKLTTCGLSQIAPNAYALGQSRSGWGAELTATLHASDEATIKLCVELLVQLAQYVNVRKTMFTEYCCVNLNRLKCQEQLPQSDIAGIVFIRDAKLESIETVHGSVDFLQIIGVNNSDWKKIKRTPALVRQYIHEMKKRNPNYCIGLTANPNVLE